MGRDRFGVVTAGNLRMKPAQPKAGCQPAAGRLDRRRSSSSLPRLAPLAFCSARERSNEVATTKKRQIRLGPNGPNAGRRPARRSAGPPVRRSQL